jgi:hypothetical protein
VVLSLRERKYPKRSLRDRKRRGGPCRAGNGHRDFDSPGQISGKSIEITKLVCTPSLSASRSRNARFRTYSGTTSSSFLVSQLSPRPPPLPREGEPGGEFLLKDLIAYLHGRGARFRTDHRLCRSHGPPTAARTLNSGFGGVRNSELSSRNLPVPPCSVLRDRANRGFADTLP